MGTKRRTLLSKFWHYLPFGCFVGAILCLCFTYGVAVGKWHLFPYRFLDTGLDSLRRFGDRKLEFLHPARDEGEGVVQYDPERVFAGVTLISQAWKDADDWHLGVLLMNLDGEVLHRWKTNPRDIWEKSPHQDCYAGLNDDKTETYVHGVLLLPNGDIVFNLEFLGLVKMNLNSEVIWKLPYRTHHSIFQDSEGNYWVCGAKCHKNKMPEYVGLKPPLTEDMILKVSPEGVIEREISMLEVIYKSGYDGLLRQYTHDILHLNDVEVLSEQMADVFDLFEAGDIMVSMRHINSIFVIDGKTERIKWSMTHPFISQHDPDFTEDGYLTVFDNHSDYAGGRYHDQGSRILRIEPSTREVTILYGWKEDQFFLTEVGGMLQHLPNGNMLITESRAAHIFEITAEGEIVWSWIASRWDGKNVPETFDAIRYSSEFVDFLTGLRKDEE